MPEPTTAAWRTRALAGYAGPSRDGALPRSMDHMARFPDVYEPSDDTYLFVDVVRSLGGVLRDVIFARERALCCLEVGSGSGTLSAVLLEELRSRGAFGLLSDCNAQACLASRQTLGENGLGGSGDAMRCDLIPDLHPAQACDVFMFNPPYVPTASEEVDRHGFGGLEAAWAGGLHGREVLNRLLPQLARAMRPKSVVFILAVEENRPDEIAGFLERELGYVCYMAGQRRAMNERLLVIMAVRGM